MRQPITLTSGDLSADEVNELLEAYHARQPIEIQGDWWEVVEAEEVAAASQGAWVFELEPVEQP